MVATVAQVLSRLDVSALVGALGQNSGPKLETPPVDWVAVAPILATFGGALLLLLITTLVPQRLPVWVTTAVTVLTSAVSLGYSIHLWGRVRSDGAIRTLGGAVVVDAMAVFAFAAIAVSVALCALLLLDFVRREGLEAVEIGALMLAS
jgi:hypothetical protein